MWQSLGLTLLVIVATLLCVLLFMLCGWYVVWQLFLSKFKFLRELVGDASPLHDELSESEAEPEAPSTPQKSRVKSARQRKAPAEEAT